MKVLPLLFLWAGLLLLSRSSLAQQATISGYLTDAASGEALIGATVREAASGQAAASNRYGFYSLTLPQGQVRLAISYLGYQPISATFALRRDTTLTLKLAPASQALGEVTVTPESAQQIAPLGLLNIPIQRLRAVPTLLGEPDILKALALTPGVSTGNEGSTGLLVRGGSPDQNLILLDEATVYNAAHLFGFVSIFNPDAIRNVDLYKGGFPARFGGRLSSVLDITMKEGNNQEMKGEASLGLLSSRFNLEGPIGGRRTSFMLSARSSYLSLFLLPSYYSYKKGNSDGFFNYWLYDVNAKLNHEFKDGGRLFFSVYNGHDYWTAYDGADTNEQNKFSINWGNTTATTRYSRALTPKLFFRSVLTYSRYRYGLDGTNSTDKVVTEQFGSESTVRDWTLRTGFDFFATPKHQLRFGTEVTSHAYQPSALTTTYARPDSLQTNTQINAGEYAVYVEDEAQIAPRLKVNAGLRASVFRVQGRTYTSMEPRLTANLLLPAHFALKGSYSLMRQYIHLLSSSGAGFPNDIWVPATRQVAPQFSRQLSLGLTKTLPQLNTEITVEAYHKTMSGLIDYRQGANFLVGAYSRDWQDEIETGGRGEAYGLEIFLNRTQGRFTGWLSYALAWNERRFAGINDGNWCPARYDRRHGFSVTGSYRLSDTWGLASTWTYSTGQPVTLPVGQQENLDGTKVLVYAGRNNARMPAYHRLDLSANYTRQTRRGRTATWSFGLYNAYNRVNPFYLDFKDVYGRSGNPDPVGRQLVVRSLFPVLPSVSYSLKF